MDEEVEEQQWKYRRERIPEHAPIPLGKLIHPEPGFSDEKIDCLLKEGRFHEARRYVHEMIKVANEVGDKQTEVNYRSYEAKIAAASTDATLGWWHKKDQEALEVEHPTREHNPPKIEHIRPPLPPHSPPHAHVKSETPVEQKDKDVQMEFLD